MSSPAPSLSPVIVISARRNTMLLLGGCFSLVFAVFQVSFIFFPANVTAYFGGPADMSTNHPTQFALICIGIGLAVAVAGAYALSGAGVIRKLPLLRTVLGAVAAVYVLRGLHLVPEVPIIIRHPGLWRFGLFSIISLSAGAVHLAGLVTLARHGRPGDIS